jgi:hypothetical protein
MVLISRSIGKSKRQNVVSLSPEDTKKTNKPKRRQILLWFFLTTDTFATRMGAVTLLFINLWLYQGRQTSNTPACNDLLTSFTTWQTALQAQLLTQLPAWYIPPLSSTTSRSNRFPSVSERIRLYLGEMWWEPKLQGVPPSSPFGKYWKERWQSHQNNQEPIVANPVDMDPQRLYECSLGTDSTLDLLGVSCENHYIRHLAHSMIDAAVLLRDYQQQSSFSRLWNVYRYEGLIGCAFEFVTPPLPATPAMLWHTGPGVSWATTRTNTVTPVFGRSRQVSGASEGLLHSSILWPVHLARDLVAKVPQYDVPWRLKPIEKIFWADALNGRRIQDMLAKGKDSSWLDIQQTIHHADATPHEELAIALQYKYLLVLEENDAPHDLLWKLFSNSVVFMAKPTYQTWAMEGLLKPWVHYIPIDNKTSLRSRFEWAQAHPQECQLISERSTLWVYDLLLAPASLRETGEIQRAMIHYYLQYVLRAKAIVHWSHLWGYAKRKAGFVVEWFAEDWLRTAFVVVLLLYRCI